ncbi:MAG TPA: hypothetical protein VMW15_10860 [Terracidiphilus sp.]|nr:hypothetical protein [Terracidiphilus sp.]
MKSAEMKLIEDELQLQCVRASAARPRHGVVPVLCLVLFVALPCGLAMAQSSSEDTGTGRLSSNPLRYEKSNVDPSKNEDAPDPVEQQRRLQQLNAAMHKSIVSDTDKLLRLVKELTAEIASTNPASLTPDQLHKVAAIEKLARSVKDDMRTSMQGTAPLMDAQPDITRISR